MKRRNFKRAKVVRMKEALKRLEAALSKFKEAKEDKKPWVSTRNGKQHQHDGRTYDSECKRMSQEINTLKEKLSATA